MQMNKLALL